MMMPEYKWILYIIDCARERFAFGRPLFTRSPPTSGPAKYLLRLYILMRSCNVNVCTERYSIRTRTDENSNNNFASYSRSTVSVTAYSTIMV